MLLLSIQAGFGLCSNQTFHSFMENGEFITRLEGRRLLGIYYCSCWRSTRQMTACHHQQQQQIHQNSIRRSFECYSYVFKFKWICLACGTCGCGWPVMLTVMRANIVPYEAMDSSKKAFLFWLSQIWGHFCSSPIIR